MQILWYSIFIILPMVIMAKHTKHLTIYNINNQIPDLDIIHNINLR